MESCLNSGNSNYRDIEIVIQDLETILTDARFKFAIESLGKIQSIKKNKNFFFSPLSIYDILCIIYLGSESVKSFLAREKCTERNLRNSLHLSNVSKANLAQHYSQERFSWYMTPKDPTILYKDETSCWITNSKILSEAVQHLFRNKLEIVNFYNQFAIDDSPSDLLRRINTSLKLKMGSADQLVELNSINQTMEIILSTMLFLNKKDNNIDNANDISYYRKRRSLASLKLGMIMNELPYDQILSMFMLFPATPLDTGRLVQNQNIPLLIKNLMTKDGMAELRKMLDSDEDSKMYLVNNVYFHFANEIPIADLLKSLNVEKLVDPDEVNLHHFVAENEQLHLGGAFHRASIRVTPDDITASAATVFFTKNEASFKLMRKFDRTFKHSFILLIYDRNRSKILFIGVMNKTFYLNVPNLKFNY